MKGNTRDNKNKIDDRPTVLVVDDRFRSFRSLSRLISKETFRTVLAPDERRGLEFLKDRKNEVRIIIVDLKSTQMGGGGFFQQARNLAPSAAIMITGPLGPFLYQKGNFYECCGLGLKHNINEVLASISGKRTKGPQSPRKAGEERDRLKERFGAIVGRSEGINEIYRLIDKLKASACTVLIQGETGVGKELVARSIHMNSDRRNQPFVPLNCGAIPANLMESELFGHERGAFTSAIDKRIGKFEAAEGGTLFLDEISELEKELQVKLLRILQEKEFQRVGGNRIHRTDVRILAATSRDLKQAVKAGHFRDDLFFRLNVFPIYIPSLRERKEDIPTLFAHFFEKTAKRMGKFPPVLSKNAEKALYGYDYPGNVRELINIVERLMVTCPNGRIVSKDLPKEILPSENGASKFTGFIKDIPEVGVRLDEIEKELILRTLEAVGNNKSEAARRLGITRRKLYLRISSYGLA